MSTPSRRHSRAVYRRRRILLLVGVLAVVALVWVLIAQPWRGAAAEGSAPAESSSPSDPGATNLPVPTEKAPPDTPAPESPAPGTPTPESPTPSPRAAAAACVASDIRVDALADAETYAAGENPQLSIRLTNEGEVDCTLNVGTTTQSFTISSGDDVWWRSTDCQTEPSDMVVLLTAGQTVTSAAPVPWDRTRSAVGTCQDPDRARAAGGGASYHLRVEIAGMASSETRQFILN